MIPIPMGNTNFEPRPKKHEKSRERYRYRLSRSSEVATERETQVIHPKYRYVGPVGPNDSDRK